MSTIPHGFPGHICLPDPDGLDDLYEQHVMSPLLDRHGADIAMELAMGGQAVRVLKYNAITGDMVGAGLTIVHGQEDVREVLAGGEERLNRYMHGMARGEWN